MKPKYDIDNPPDWDKVCPDEWPWGSTSLYRNQGTWYSNWKLTAARSNLARIEWTKVTGMSPITSHNRGHNARLIFCKEGKSIVVDEEDDEDRFQKYSSETYKRNCDGHGKYVCKDRLKVFSMDEKFSMDHILPYFPDATECALVLLDPEGKFLKVCKRYPVNQTKEGT